MEGNGVVKEGKAGDGNGRGNNEGKLMVAVERCGNGNEGGDRVDVKMKKYGYSDDD